MSVITLQSALLAQDKESLVEKVLCGVEGAEKDGGFLAGIEEHIREGFLPQEAKTYEFWTKAYTDPNSKEQAEAELTHIVKTQRDIAGFVEIERIVADPFAAKPDTPYANEESINITISEGRDYEGEGGEARFTEDLQNICEVQEQMLGLPGFAKICAETTPKKLENIKEIVARNQRLARRLKNADPKDWDQIISEEMKPLMKLFKERGLTSCQLNEDGKRALLLTEYGDVDRTNLCWGWTLFLPADFEYLEGMSTNAQGRPIGRAILMDAEGKLNAFAAPRVSQNWVLNPIWAHAFGGEPDAWHKMIGESQQFGPGPITLVGVSSNR